MLEVFGLVLETLGIIIILGTQAIFFWRVREKYGSLGTAFLDIEATRIAMDEDKLEETARDKQKLKEAFKRHPHAKLLYENFKYSVFGLIVGVVGLILQLVGNVPIP